MSSIFSWLRPKRKQKSPQGRNSIATNLQRVSPEPGAEALGEPIRHAESLLAGDPGKALEILEGVIRNAPENTKALRLAGEAALRLKDMDAASDYFNLGLHFAPNEWELVRCKVGILRTRGDTRTAKMDLASHLAIYPDNNEAKLQLAEILYGDWDYQAAINLLREVVASDPNNCTALNFLGILLARETGDLKQGEAAVSLALRLDSRFHAAASNLGWILAEQGRLDEALIYFNQVLASNPADGETRLMRAYANLKQGKFSAGWADFDARLGSAMHPQRASFLASLSSESGLAGRRVFVAAEQGLGDQIMFASCVPDLLAESSGCLIECDDRLVPLFRRSFPKAEFIGQGASELMRKQVIEAHGCLNEISMGSLAGRYRNQWTDFPQHSGYLRADQSKVNYWKTHLDQLGPGPKIGISWRGGVASTRQQLRSVPLRTITSQLSGFGTLVNLQYGDCLEEIGRNEKDSGTRVAHWQSAIEDYDETAALVMALDLVISVCTAIVHLGGALGKPVWVLTPAISEWRYLAKGDVMPWYPSVRLFRQSESETWTSVLKRVSRSIWSMPPWE